MFFNFTAVQICIRVHVSRFAFIEPSGMREATNYRCGIEILCGCIPWPRRDFRLQTSDLGFQTSNLRVQTSDFGNVILLYLIHQQWYRGREGTSALRLQTSDFGLQTSDSSFQTRNFGLRTSDFGLKGGFHLNLNEI